MTIKIFCVGKTREKHFRLVIDEYLRRIRRYTPVEYTEIKAEKRKKTGNDEQMKQRECEKIRQLIPAQSVVVALDEHGTHYSSREFSRFISRYHDQGSVKTLTFVTGGVTGFSETFLKSVDSMVSLSKMTFPHQLCRLIFVEQLYRAYTILAGQPYHKE